MARKKTSNEPKKPLELLVPADDAKAKLLERIDKGMAIRNTQMNSEQTYKDVKKEYSKWDDFNTELLKRQFSSSELADEYSRWVGVGVISMYGPQLGEQIRDLQKDIDDKIHRIDSIIERIELIPLANSVDVSSSTSSPKPKALDTSKVFIVHGHDNEAKLEVARFIEKIGFEPIILHEQASGSKTIIEKNNRVKS